MTNIPEHHPASQKQKPDSRAPAPPKDEFFDVGGMAIGGPAPTGMENLRPPGKQPIPTHTATNLLGEPVATVVGPPFTKEDLLALHDETCSKARTIMEQKNNDYTGGQGAADPFANFRMAEVIGMDPVMGLLLRMMDKIQRVRTFASDGELKVSGESVDDAFDDMVNYAILGKGMMRERRR